MTDNSWNLHSHTTPSASHPLDLVVSIYLMAAETFNKIYGACRRRSLPFIIPQLNDFFRLSDYGYRWRPAMREDEPSMWLYDKLVK
jgi:hypothetical protein